MPRFLLTLPLAVLLLAGCNATTSGNRAEDIAAREAALLPRVEASPGLEDWARMGEVGVAFGPQIAQKVFEGLSAADKATLLAFSRSAVGRSGEFATLRYAAPNGWAFERMFLRAEADRPCALYEFHARRGTADATGFALGCQVKDALLVYSVGGADVTSPNIVDSMLSFVPDGRLERVADFVRADAGRSFKVSPPPATWEELGARRAQWRSEFREDAPILVDRAATRS